MTKEVNKSSLMEVSGQVRERSHVVKQSSSGEPMLRHSRAVLLQLKGGKA